MKAAEMSWTWRYDPTEAAAPVSETFTNQADAESWLGESWRELAAAGVVGVTLVCDGKDVYGPMPLAE
jgi:hypothetical protein